MNFSPKVAGLGLLSAVSLAANVVLFARLAPTRSAESEREINRAVAAANSPEAARAIEPTLPSDPVSPLHWAQLKGRDLQELGRALLAAGFPPRLVRSILSELHDRPWRERFSLARDTAPYWRTSVPGAQPVSNEELHARHRERRQLLDEVFGSAQAQMLESNAYLESRYGFLSAEKAAQVLSIQQDYAELITADRPKTAAELAAFAKRQKLLEEQQRADLATILTPEELHEYDLRNSTTRLVFQPKFMELAEAEYRALFAVFHQPVNALLAQPASEDSPPPRPSRTELFERLQPQIREILGGARYVEYIQAMDPESEKLNRVAARFDLPLAAAAQVAAARHDATARAGAISRDAALTAAQKTAALASLQAETTAKIGAAFGARAAEAYLGYDGKWLAQLTAGVRP